MISMTAITKMYKFSNGYYLCFPSLELLLWIFFLGTELDVAVMLLKMLLNCKQLS